MINRRFAIWIPLIFTLLLSAVTLLFYTLKADYKNIIVYLQISSLSFVPAVFPLLEIITKSKFSITANALIASHILMACNLGGAMSFYQNISWWDLFLHGYFGLVAGVTLHFIFLKLNAGRMNKWGFYSLIFLSTLGLAAIWEIIEYLSDSFLGSDAQRVREALANGLSPIEDTMTDIIITVAGITLFYVFLAIFTVYKKKTPKTNF